MSLIGMGVRCRMIISISNWKSMWKTALSSIRSDLTSGPAGLFLTDVIPTYEAKLFLPERRKGKQFVANVYVPFCLGWFFFARNDESNGMKPGDSPNLYLAVIFVGFGVFVRWPWRSLAQSCLSSLRSLDSSGRWSWCSSSIETEMASWPIVRHRPSLSRPRGHRRRVESVDIETSADSEHGWLDGIAQLLDGYLSTKAAIAHSQWSSSRGHQRAKCHITGKGNLRRSSFVLHAVHQTSSIG